MAFFERYSIKKTMIFQKKPKKPRMCNHSGLYILTAVFFHPDSTVGFGIKPNLLKNQLAGSSALAALPPVGNLTPPQRLYLLKL